jgi:membrane-associated phospholipid phosphatase
MLFCFISGTGIHTLMIIIRALVIKGMVPITTETRNILPNQQESPTMTLITRITTQTPPPIPITAIIISITVLMTTILPIIIRNQSETMVIPITIIILIVVVLKTSTNLQINNQEVLIPVLDGIIIIKIEILPSGVFPSGHRRDLLLLSRIIRLEEIILPCFGKTTNLLPLLSRRIIILLLGVSRITGLLINSVTTIIITKESIRKSL